MDVKAIERKHIRAIRDAAASRKVTTTDDKGNEVTETIDIPSRANKVVTVLSILLTRSVEIGWRKDNPALRFPKLKTTGEGYRAWTDDEVATFLAFVEDKPFWRLAFKLALYTGQRGQDQVAMPWAFYDGSSITLRQLKTNTLVTVPIHSELKAELDQAERHGDYILMRTFNRARSETGRKKGDWEPWETNAFQSAASDITDEAGLEGVVWHGLRATASTRLAESGSSEREIMAITGHKTTQMVSKYAENARRKVMGKAAMDRLERSETPATTHSAADTVANEISDGG
jgi:integrase